MSRFICSFFNFFIYGFIFYYILFFAKVFLAEVFVDHDRFGWILYFDNLFMPFFYFLASFLIALKLKLKVLGLISLSLSAAFIEIFLVSRESFFWGVESDPIFYAQYFQMAQPFLLVLIPVFFLFFQKTMDD